MVGRAALFSCSQTEAQIASSGAVRVYGGADRSQRWYIGEVLNQSTVNPIIASFKAGKLQWCRTDYESTADQSVGYGLLYNKDPFSSSPPSIYAVFSSRSHQVGVGDKDFRRFATTGRQPNQGVVPGGSRACAQGDAKVSVIAKVDPTTGDVLAATYVTSRRLFGLSGSLTVTGLDHSLSTRAAGETITVRALSSAVPLRPNQTRMRCTVNGPYNYTITYASDLEMILSAQTPSCA